MVVILALHSATTVVALESSVIYAQERLEMPTEVSRAEL